MRPPRLAALLALVFAAACGGTQKAPVGPPPEYEDPGGPVDGAVASPPPPSSPSTSSSPSPSASAPSTAPPTPADAGAPDADTAGKPPTID